MLRTNSKAVCERIKAYIMDGADVVAEDNNTTFPDFESFARFIDERFKEEYLTDWRTARPYNRQSLFVEWTQGLPLTIGDQWLYAPVSPVDILGDILEQTEEERHKYSDDQAAEMLTKLMYREIIKAVRK